MGLNEGLLAAFGTVPKAKGGVLAGTGNAVRTAVDSYGKHRAGMAGPRPEGLRGLEGMDKYLPVVATDYQVRAIRL